jgi:ABC-type enterochelin transport system substrate-binding protein
MSDFLKDLFTAAGRGLPEIFEQKEKAKEAPKNLEARISELENNVDSLSMAILVLLNSADKKSQASIPSTVADSKPKIYIETKNHPEKKFIKIVTIRAEISK